MAYVDDTRPAPSPVLPDMLDGEAFARRLEMAVKMAGRQRQEVALLLLSVPALDPGQTAAWRECARAIRCAVRITDCMALLDHQRFGILLAVDDFQGACAASNKVHAALSRARAGDQPVAAGLAIFPIHGSDAGQLFSLASEALARSAAQGGGLQQAKVCCSTAEELRRQLRQRLGEALRQDEIVLGFQPVVSLRTGLPVAAEVLARWEHPGLGALDSGEFLAYAEQPEYAETFNLRVIEQALRQLACWQKQGIRMRISINLSASMLEMADFEYFVAARLAASGLAARSLCFEIKDAALSRLSEPARQALFGLAASGVGLCIDDFGRGEGSLFALRDLPVEMLKFDIPLSTGACGNEEDAEIFETLLTHGRRRGKQIIAKGVETAAMRDRLARLGCEFAQGYYYARALPAPAFERWRAERLAG
ncbi:EAL domain-containing protein [Uliginosibacterium paludis]|uniref:GGDEF domain-containing phosphodiesterase n=1 Tax=Uliginosibacterium paludis TaxID=1615952 RepID=A0ABV2CR55_9RHOO